MTSLTESESWRALSAHAEQIAPLHLRDCFVQTPQRFDNFSLQASGLFMDYSKQRVTDETMKRLFQLAHDAGLEDATRACLSGEKINHTENRAALHSALRSDAECIEVEGENIMPAVRDVLGRMEDFAGRVRSGEWRGATGKRITDVVNIGIGGSDLGPRMVCQALKDFQDGPRCHFVANVDAAELDGVLQQIDPATTLFIVTSKTFTTAETMANAASASDWLVSELGPDAIEKHFVAVSTNRKAVEKFGIDPTNMFGFWDWVGGRYSLWSAVGLSIALAVGMSGFRALLAGAREMDTHFSQAPVQQNMPVILGLLGIWNSNFLGRNGHVVAPYCHHLARLPAWLQQLEMESNGKSVDNAGALVDYSTTPALWGDVGTNAQHAFFQMLHQGPQWLPVDFILPLQASHHYQDQQRMLVANCLAQSAALMRGKTADEVRLELLAQGLAGEQLEQAIPHRVFSGNRPSTTITMPALTPRTLGAVLALYEHKVLVQSVIWNINAFDQWGVELGKSLANQVLTSLQSGDSSGLDASTKGLVNRFLNKA